jgi:hypothetical protein
LAEQCDAMALDVAVLKGATVNAPFAAEMV